MMHLAAAVLLALAQTNDKAQANGYDDAWKAAWRTQCRTVLLGGTGKTDGFVLHIGDSITYSSAYGAWIGGGAGRTNLEDLPLCNWINNFAVPGGIDATSMNGLYLAHKDIPGGNRAMTAAGGIATDEFLSGNNNGGPQMPATMNVGTAQGYVSSSTYTGNLQIQTVAYAFSGAQIAVLMLGTNDCSAGRTAAAFIADLQTIVTTLEGNHIAVVLSTIPPHSSNNALAIQYNTQITNYARSHGLPLIDFYAEILARQPVNYASTLMNPGDVHPSGDRAGYTVSSDPYANGGDPATHKTGAAAAEVGYLLRSWPTVQKLKEVQSFVVTGNPAVPANPAPAPPGPAPAPTPSSGSGGGGGGGHCGGSISGPVSPEMLLISALAALALLGAARKTGF